MEEEIKIKSKILNGLKVLELNGDYEYRELLSSNNQYGMILYIKKAFGDEVLRYECGPDYKFDKEALNKKIEENNIRIKEIEKRYLG